MRQAASRSSFASSWHRFAAAAAIAVAATGALAGLEKGDEPKSFGSGVSYVNCESVDFSALRGRVVVLQLSHTESEPAVKHLADLAELHKKHGEKGMDIVLVFGEPREGVVKLVEKHEVPFPVVANAKSAREDYGLVKGFPTTYVLDPDGKVAWKGNFADLAEPTIASLLSRVSDVPWLPPELDELAGKMRAGEHVAARELLDEATTALELRRKELAAAESPDDGAVARADDDAARLTEARAWLDAKAEQALEVAVGLHKKAKLYEARNEYLAHAAKYAGSEAAAKAKAAADALMADKSTRREIEGWGFFLEQFEEAKKIEIDDRKGAIKLLKKVVSKYRGTQAAAKAEYWIERLKAAE